MTFNTASTSSQLMNDVKFTDDGNGNGSGDYNDNDDADADTTRKTAIDRPKRAANACNVCRRIKMRCVVLNGDSHAPVPPCQRCARIGHACSFDEALSCPKTRKRKASNAAARSKMNDGAAGNSSSSNNNNSSSDDVLQQLQAARRRIAEMEESMRQRNTRSTAMSPPALPVMMTMNKLSRKSRGSVRSVSSDSSFSGSRRRSNSTGSSSTAGSITNTTSVHISSYCMDDDDDDDANSRNERLDEPTYPLGLLAEASLHADERPADSAGAGGGAIAKSSSSSVKSPASSITASTADTSATTAAAASAAAAATANANAQRLLHPCYLRRRRRTGGAPLSSTQSQPFWRGNEPSPEAHEIITSGLVTWSEVVMLHGMFFSGPAQHFLTLDADMHTPERVATRSSVLLTAMCAVGARYHVARPTLHVELYRIAARLAAMTVVDGVKSVEIVQALLLLSMWPLPSSHWTEDRAWLLSGLALRMATELNLHEHGCTAPTALLASWSSSSSKSTDEASTLDELRNRQRVYLTCFAVDRSFSTLQGRHAALPESPLTMNNRDWTMTMPGCKPWDVGICSFVDLMRTMTVQLAYLRSRHDMRQGNRGGNAVAEMSTSVDRELLAQIHLFDDQIDQWKEYWSKRGLFDSMTGSANDAEQWQQRPLDERLFISLVKQAPLRLGYAKLVINSFGLQHCLAVIGRHRQRGGGGVGDDNNNNGNDDASTDVHVLFSRCWRAARQVVLAALEGLRPVLRYAPATQLLVVCYASVSLLKLRRHPLLLANMSGVQDDAVQLVVQVAELLDSIALDDSHTPALYASFLWSLVRAQHDGGSGGQSQGQDAQQVGDISAANDARTTAFDEAAINAAAAESADALFSLPPPQHLHHQQQQQQHHAQPSNTLLASDVLATHSDSLLPGDDDNDEDAIVRRSLADFDAFGGEFIEFRNTIFGAGGMGGGGFGGGNGSGFSGMGNFQSASNSGGLQDDHLLSDDFWTTIAPTGLTRGTGTLIPSDLGW